MTLSSKLSISYDLVFKITFTYICTISTPRFCFENPVATIFIALAALKCFKWLLKSLKRMCLEIILLFSTYYTIFISASRTSTGSMKMFKKQSRTSLLEHNSIFILICPFQYTVLKFKNKICFAFNSF